MENCCLIVLPPWLYITLIVHNTVCALIFIGCLFFILLLILSQRCCTNICCLHVQQEPTDFICLFFKVLLIFFGVVICKQSVGSKIKTYWPESNQKLLAVIEAASTRKSMLGIQFIDCLQATCFDA